MPRSSHQPSYGPCPSCGERHNWKRVYTYATPKGHSPPSTCLSPQKQTVWDESISMVVHQVPTLCSVCRLYWTMVYYTERVLPSEKRS